MKATPTPFSTAVKSHIGAQYSSLREAAKHLRIHSGHLSRITSGEALPEAELLDRMVTALSLSQSQRLELLEQYALAKVHRDLSCYPAEVQRCLARALMNNLASLRSQPLGKAA
jgi:transcriptional regulator with XRE-family HTH domain